MAFPHHSAKLVSTVSQSEPRKYFYSRFSHAPLSLATTRGISFDFFSSPYLDVSVRGVPHVYLCIQYTLHGSSPCEFPHSEICGSFAYLQLTAAYRSLSRPSSAPDAKAFALCSYSLELPISLVLFMNCLSFFVKQDNIFYSQLKAEKRNFQIGEQE